jgi:hypothetical protein
LSRPKNVGCKRQAKAQNNIQRELADYAHLSQSAMQSTRIIAESLAQWKQVGDWSPHTAH